MTGSTVEKADSPLPGVNVYGGSKRPSMPFKQPVHIGLRVNSSVGMDTFGEQRL